MSSILTMWVAASAFKSLQQQFPYQWQSKILQYLGIILAFPTSATYKSNYHNLISTIKEDLTHIMKYGLTWMG